MLAALAVLSSAAPAWLAWPLAMAALVSSVLLAGWESRRARPRLFLPGGDGTPWVDGRAVADLRVVRRGPLTVLAWRSRTGRWHYRSCWPDSLSRPLRRELTLAAEDWRVSPSRRSMAP